MPTRLTSPCGSYSCCIVIGQGKELEVFQPTATDKAGSCFLASVPNEDYSIYVFVHNADPATYYPDFVADFTIDGVACGNRINHPTKETVRKVWVDDVRTGNACRRLFFAPVEFAHDGYAPTQQELQELATINITIVRARYGKLDETSQDAENKALDLGPIVEQPYGAMLGCVTGYGQPEVKTSTVVRGTVTHPDDVISPIYTFNIRYAPLSMLQAHGIAPAHLKGATDKPSASASLE